MNKLARNEWCMVLWQGPAGWNMIKGTKSTNFNEHVEAFKQRAALSPPGHVKSIHVCWLDDIANWDSPEEDVKVEIDGNKVNVAMKVRLGLQEGARPFSPDFGVEIDKLSDHDRREYRKFLKFLRARQKYGEAVLLKRKFWRRYLGIE